MNIRFSLALAALLGTVLLPAQDETTSKKWHFGLFASPDFSFRSLAGNTGTSAQIAGTRNGFELPKIAFTAGGEVLYRHAEKWSFTGGLQLSIKGDATEVITLVYVSPQGPVPPPPGEPTTAQFFYNSRYIDLPLRADYYFSRKKIAPFITAGISTNIFINERVVSHTGYADGRKGKSANVAQNGYHRVNPQVQLGGGIDVTLPTGMLRVLPLARMSVLPVNSGSVDGYFYSVGLGVNYFL